MGSIRGPKPDDVQTREEELIELLRICVDSFYSAEEGTPDYAIRDSMWTYVRYKYKKLLTAYGKDETLRTGGF